MAQQSPRRLELTVTADQAGEKIDTLLRRELRLSAGEHPAPGIHEPTRYRNWRRCGRRRTKGRPCGWNTASSS